jgi:hypothetical protein
MCVRLPPSFPSSPSTPSSLNHPSRQYICFFSQINPVSAYLSNGFTYEIRGSSLSAKLETNLSSVAGSLEGAGLKPIYNQEMRLWLVNARFDDVPVRVVYDINVRRRKKGGLCCLLLCRWCRVDSTGHFVILSPLVIISSSGPSYPSNLFLIRFLCLYALQYRSPSSPTAGTRP